MNWRDRITADPKVLVGKPVIKGTRIAVEFLMELLAEGWTHEQILGNYPHLTSDDIQAALHLVNCLHRLGGNRTTQINCPICLDRFRNLQCRPRSPHGTPARRVLFALHLAW